MVKGSVRLGHLVLTRDLSELAVHFLMSCLAKSSDFAPAQADFYYAPRKFMPQRIFSRGDFYA